MGIFRSFIQITMIFGEPPRSKRLKCHDESIDVSLDLDNPHIPVNRLVFSDLRSMPPTAIAVVFNHLPMTQARPISIMIVNLNKN